MAYSNQYEDEFHSGTRKLRPSKWILGIRYAVDRRHLEIGDEPPHCMRERSAIMDVVADNIDPEMDEPVVLKGFHVEKHPRQYRKSRVPRSLVETASDV